MKTKLSKLLAVLLSLVFVVCVLPFSASRANATSVNEVVEAIKREGIHEEGLYSIYYDDTTDGGRDYFTLINYDPSKQVISFSFGTYADALTGFTFFDYDVKGDRILNGEVVSSVKFYDGSIDIGVYAAIDKSYNPDTATYSFKYYKSIGSHLVPSKTIYDYNSSIISLSFVYYDTLLYAITGYGLGDLGFTYSGFHKNSSSSPAAPAPSKLPAFDPEAGGEGVSGFVSRLYSVVLGRAGDKAGTADWEKKLKSGSISGADAARGFLNSSEFTGKGYSDSDFVEILYRLFFNRDSDSAGKNNWLNQLANGASRESVIKGFVNSTEWANVCLRFGIESGGNGVPNISVIPSDGVIDFSKRLYTKCLGRNYDQTGLDDWSRRLANHKISGSEAAHGFFFSTEFVGANYSNEEYVTRLYRTFMDREPDAAGFNDWVGKLNAGTSREAVFQGFTGSQEWIGICSKYGINR